MINLNFYLLEKSKKIYKIPKKKIMGVAFNLIKNAKKELLLTMLIKEEINQPLARLYINTLQRTINKGVKVKRLCFGNKKEFEKIINNKISEGVKLYHINKVRLYRRMMIKDKKEMIFGVKKGRIYVFFYSKDRSVILKYLGYFEKIKLRSSGCFRSGTGVNE